MKKQWKFVVAGVGAILLAIILILLFSGDSQNDNKDEKAYRIGVITSLTGPVAPYGQSALNGIQLAVDEINNGPYPHIKIIVEDDGSSTQNAVSAFKKVELVISTQIRARRAPEAAPA